MPGDGCRPSSAVADILLLMIGGLRRRRMSFGGGLDAPRRTLLQILLRVGLAVHQDTCGCNDQLVHAAQAGGLRRREERRRRLRDSCWLSSTALAVGSCWIPEGEP